MTPPQQQAWLRELKARLDWANRLTLSPEEAARQHDRARRPVATKDGLLPNGAAIGPRTEPAGERGRRALGAEVPQPGLSDLSGPGPHLHRTPGGVVSGLGALGSGRQPRRPAETGSWPGWKPPSAIPCPARSAPCRPTQRSLRWSRRRTGPARRRRTRRRPPPPRNRGTRQEVRRLGEEA